MLKATKAAGDVPVLKADYYITPTEIDLLVFDKLIAQDHYLRRLKAAIDFDPLRLLLADCYSPRMGRTAEDPVRLLKLCFLQFHYQLSDREVIATAQVNVAFRFFLDLSLDSPLPVPSLLTQFRTRLGVERFGQVFDEVLRQARQHGLVSDRLRLKDATHVISNIAVPSTIQLLAQVRERLLELMHGFAADSVAAHRRRAEEIRASTADLKDEQRLLARVYHLREIVCWAEQNEAQLMQAASPEQNIEFVAVLELAHKVLADRQPQAKDKLLSLVDVDARTGKHGDYFDGYLLDVSMDSDSELICAVELLAANGDEAGDAKKLIEAEESAQGNDIESLSVDSIGFRGEVLRELSDERGPNLTVYVPPYNWPGQRPGLFEPKDFQLTESGDKVVCPGQQQSASRVRAGRGQGWQYVFRARECHSCELRLRCLKEGAKAGRTVIKNDYEVEYQAARQRAETEAYKEVRKQHPRIERKLAEIIRRHGGRRVRYRGRVRAKIQYVVTAVVVNFKRIVKLLNPPRQLQPA